VTSESNNIHAQLSWVGLLAEVRPLVKFLRRWWLLAVLMVMLTSIATLGYLLVMGVQYEVSASLLYQIGPELAPPPTMAKDQMVIVRRMEDVNDEIEILTSPDLIQGIVADLGEAFFRPQPPTSLLGKFKYGLQTTIQSVTGQIDETMIQLGLRRRVSFLEKMEEVLVENLEVKLVRDSDVISITLETPAPDAGELILQKLLDAYQERHLAIHQESAVKNFLSEQVSKVRQELVTSRDQLLEFQIANELWSSDDQQKLLLENRKTLQLQAALTSSKAANLESHVANLTAIVADLPETIELNSSEQTNPAVISLEEKLSALGLNSAVVNATYRKGSVESVAQQRQLQRLEAVLDDQPSLIPYTRTEGINQIRQELVREHALKAAERAGLQSQLVVEAQQIRELETSLRTLGEAIAKYQHLDREHTLLKEKYALYVENFEKADIASVMNLARISNVELISPPIASKQPVRPRIKLAALVGVISGLVLAGPSSGCKIGRRIR
jgi:uncharacterized protein involved in exopolysaccharide biosynthesis